MNTKQAYSPFKDRLQTRRVCEVPGRREDRRSRVYRTQVAGVRVRIG